MVATIELKRCVTRTGVFGVVVGKLRHQEEPCPVILLPIYEGTKVYFYCAVLAFRLSVGLRVECGGKSLLDAKEITERGSKLGHKNRSPVTYDRVRVAVISYYHVYNYFR